MFTNRIPSVHPAGIAMLFIFNSLAVGQVIRNDTFWKDTDGNPILSQGGGTIKVGEIWYWYGAKYGNAATYYNEITNSNYNGGSGTKVSCYSSKDLVNWKFEGDVYTASGGWFGRLGVVYHAKTGKYVLIAQGNENRVVFASSDTPTGQFTFHSLQTPPGVANGGTGDQTVFQDDDGKAYIICSSKNGRANLYVIPLRESDYLGMEPAVRIFGGFGSDWDIKFTNHPLDTNFNNTFKVVDRVPKVDYGGWGNFNGEFGHAANKSRTWSYYLLRIEYRVGERQVNGGPAWALQNNGLMLHSQSMASMTLNQDFPVSLETQLLGAANVGADNSSSMNLCTPGTGFQLNLTGGSPSTAHCQFAATGPRPRPGEWTWVSVSVMGDSVIRHYLGDNPSGNAVFTYCRPVYLSGGISSPPSNLPANGTPIKPGDIAIQAETHPYDFRKIEVLDLEGCMDRSKAAYRTYFLRSKPGACDVTGLGKQQDALPENLSLLRNSGGFAYLSTEAGTLEVADPSGRTLSRTAVTAGVPNSLALTRRGLYLVTWRSTAATARFKLTFL